MAGKSGHKQNRQKRSYAPRRGTKPPGNVLLLDAVVRVVAARGVEGTSTRAIAAEAGNGITDTVIYRFFAGKEDLMRQAFLRESEVCMREAESRLPVLWEMNLSRIQRMRFFWHSLWTWTTAHREISVFLIRYYYSACFDREAERDYRAIWHPVVDRLRDLLPDTTVETLCFTGLETLASAAYPVCCGRTPDTASASENGFRRLMGLVSEYLDPDDPEE